MVVQKFCLGTIKTESFKVPPQGNWIYLEHSVEVQAQGCCQNKENDQLNCRAAINLTRKPMKDIARKSPAGAETRLKDCLQNYPFKGAWIELDQTVKLQVASQSNL